MEKDLVSLGNDARALTAAEFQGLSKVLPELEWFANIYNEKTRWSYQGDTQARAAPTNDTLKGKRDRAVLATLLYHGIRREELCKLKLKDLHQREGVPRFRIVEASGHGEDLGGPLFRPVKNNATGGFLTPLQP